MLWWINENHTTECPIVKVVHLLILHKHMVWGCNFVKNNHSKNKVGGSQHCSSTVMLVKCLSLGLTHLRQELGGHLLSHPRRYQWGHREGRNDSKRGMQGGGVPRVARTCSSLLPSLAGWVLPGYTPFPVFPRPCLLAGMIQPTEEASGRAVERSCWEPRNCPLQMSHRYAWRIWSIGYTDCIKLPWKNLGKPCLMMTALKLLQSWMLA